MAQRKLTAEQRRWRAEGDAECLAQARVIEQDAQRFNAARKIAQERADMLKKEAQALQSVAQRKRVNNMENKTQGRQNNDPRTQKFYFSEEGELIVESNRGIYVDGRQYVKMYGNFTCNAKVMGEIINKLRSIPVEVGIEEKVRMLSDAVVDDILGVHEHTIQHYCVLGASEERISEYEHTCAEQRYTNSEIERLKIRLENMNVHAENLKKEKESLFTTYNKAIAAYNALPWWKRIFKHVEI